MTKSASYDDLLMKMLKEEGRATAYLNAALDEQDRALFLVALGNVTRAYGGIGKLARRTGLNRESLYRALSEKGNPSIHTLASILRALGIRLGVETMDESSRPAKSRRPLGQFKWESSLRSVVAWPEPQAMDHILLTAA